MTVSLGDFLLRFLEKAPAYVYLMDTELRYIYLNEASRHSPAYEGLPLDELIGKRGQDFPMNADVPELAAHDKEVIATGKAQMFEEQIVGVRLLSIKWPVRDESGEIVAVGGISLDITDLADLQEKKMQYLARAVDNSQDIIEAISTASAELIRQTSTEHPHHHSAHDDFTD